MKYPNIILVGPPGSGKGSLSNILIKEHQYIQFSTGDMFRQISKNPTTVLEKEIKNIMMEGKLISDEITNKLINAHIIKAKEKNQYFILDGYPRTIEQAEYLKSIFDIDLVLYISINEELAVKRISGRISCPKCKSIYNTFFSPPKINNKCDKCNTTLTKRKDDNQKIATERYKVYEEKTAPLIKFYQAENKLITICADTKTIDEIALYVLELIKI